MYPSDFQTKTLCAFIIYPMRAAYYINHIFLYLITLVESTNNESLREVTFSKL
jgi:hypothetical protein